MEADRPPPPIASEIFASFLYGGIRRGRPKPSPMDIWYQLADHNGNPFMGTSIDKVSLKPDAYVVDLRDAVKIKLADSHLRGISPSDLKVFTSNNKTETLLSPRARLRDYMSDTLIVKVPAVDLAKAALTPAEESSNLTFVKRLKLQEAPSKVANVENAKIKFSAEDCQYLVHRPLDRTGDPVVLLECVFGEFVENCATIPLRETDYYDALRFQSLMVKFYGQEEERYKVVNTFLSDYLKVSVERLGTDIASSRTMDIGHRVRNGILILHGEVKNELGTSNSCPYLQHALYYGQSVPERNDFISKYRFPSFGIYIAGPFFGITGSVFVGKKYIVCDPLTDMVTVLSDNKFDDTQVMKIARILASLRNGISKLNKEALQLDENLNALPPVDVYPYFRYSVTLRTPLIYTNRVEDKLVFTCTGTNTGDRIFIVKFTKSYCADAHRFSEAGGFAPQLHEVTQLPGGWLAVIMGAVSPVMASEIDDPEQRQQVAAKMDQYLTYFHGGGFVHGDFRPANILVSFDQSGKMIQNVQVIDFDHGGRKGSSFYPCSINPSIVWAEGVKGGAPILPEHDRHFLNLYRNNKPLVK